MARETVRLFMTLKTLFNYTLWLLLTVAVANVSAGPLRQLTIVKTDGTTLENVQCEIYPEMQVIVVHRGEKVESVPYYDIESITDDKGYDITDAIIGKEIANDIPAWKGNPVTMKKDSRRRYNLNFVLAPNLGIPTGDYYGKISSGIGYYTALSVAILSKLDIRLSYTKSGMNASPDLFPVKFKAEKVQLNGLVHQSFGGKLEEYLEYYGYLGIGLVRNKAEYEPESFKYSETNFSFNFGAGIIVMMGSGIGLDMGGGLDLQDLSDKYQPNYYYDPYGRSGNVEAAISLDYHLGLIVFI